MVNENLNKGNKENVAKTTPINKSQETANQSLNTIEGYKEKLLATSKNAMSALKAAIEAKRKGGMTKRGIERAGILGHNLAQKIKVVSEEGFGKISQVIDKKNAGEIGETESLSQISGLTEAYKQKVEVMKQSLTSYIGNIAAGGTDSERLDYEDIARMEADFNMSIDKVSELLLSKDKKIVAAFNDALKGGPLLAKHFPIISEYINSQSVKQDFAWTIVRTMRPSAKKAFTKEHLKNFNDEEKLDFFNRGVERGVYSPVEKENNIKNAYEGEEGQKQRTIDQEKYNKIRDLSKQIGDISTYDKLNDIGDKLGVKGIGKFLVKLLAGLTIGSNFIVNAFARDGKFRIGDAIKNGLVTNPYALGAAGIIGGIKMSEKDKKLDEMLTSKEKKAKQNEKAGRLAVKNLIYGNKGVNDLLKTPSVSGANGGSEAMAGFVAYITNKNAAEKNNNVKIKSGFTTKEFRKWLANERTYEGKIKFPKVIEFIDMNNKKGGEMIDEEKFNKLAEAYQKMRIDPSKARRMEAYILEKK